MVWHPSWAHWSLTQATICTNHKNHTKLIHSHQSPIITRNSKIKSKSNKHRRIFALRNPFSFLDPFKFKQIPKIQNPKIPSCPNSLLSRSNQTLAINLTKSQVLQFVNFVSFSFNFSFSFALFMENMFGFLLTMCFAI